MTPFRAHRGKVGEAPKLSLIPALPKKESSWWHPPFAPTQGSAVIIFSPWASEFLPKGHGKPCLETQPSLVLETQLPKTGAPPPTLSPPGLLCGGGVGRGGGGGGVGCLGMLICWPPGKELRGPGGVLSEDNE